MSIVVGRMGISPAAFRWMTVAELIVTVSAYREKQQEEYRERWERERWGIANVVNIQLDPKDRQSPEVMFPFPWDKKVRKFKKPGKKPLALICEKAKELAAELKA